MLGFLILLFVMFAVWGILLGTADVSEISKNWDKHRCEPSVMPFASFFGHDTKENFQFCLKDIMKSNLGPAFSPIYTILGTFLGTLGNMMNMANSMRVEFATFMGGINTVLQNFMDRFVQLTTNVRVAAMRMRMLFGRLYGMFFAVIYMSMSGITAMQNFGDTILFKFLDTFCFAPETLVDIQGKGQIEVKDVKIGDIFTKTGGRVTSTFQFDSDGQTMVEFPGGIVVSTNHYIVHDGGFRRSDEHPDAKPVADWNGGSTRPLICFNTSDHRIPVGEYIFVDYDETEQADHQTMAWIDSKLNATSAEPSKTYKFDYTTVFKPTQRVRIRDSLIPKPANTIPLGAHLSTGRVIGIVQKEVTDVCLLPTGECVTPGCSFWDHTACKWYRAGDVYPIGTLSEPQIFMNFVVKSTASVEFASGVHMRDYVEIHSPDSEQFYAKAIEAV